MRVFVTGASGWIGTATVSELLAAGHDVVGLARSDASAARIEQAGATVHRGSIDDLDSIRAGAQGADAVAHLAYNHDFSDMAGAARTDRAVIDVLGDVLAENGGALAVASGVLGVDTTGVVTETDRPVPGADAHPRLVNAIATLALADRGVRSALVRFAPTVHGTGDHGFIATYVQIAREHGVAGYVGDGANRWPAVHVSDAGRLVRLALEQAEPGAIVHAVAEEGVTIREVAEIVGHKLDLPVRSVPAGDADQHFSWLGRFLAADLPASSTLTRERYGWTPTGPTLTEDLESGAYTR